MDKAQDIIKQALSLKAIDRYRIVSAMLESLDETDETIADIWTDEAVRRLESVRSGGTETVSYEQFFDR
jgi:putative addiction module component (TIGR02574 family)